MELANVSPSKILVVSLMQSLMEISKTLLPRRSLTSTLKFQQNCRELIQESLILAILMLMLPNGKQKQKILLQDSTRTSLNMKETKLVKHLLLLVLSYNSSELQREWSSGHSLFWYFFIYEFIQKVSLPFPCQRLLKKHGLLRSDKEHWLRYVLQPAPDHVFLWYPQTVRSLPPDHRVLLRTPLL